MVAPFASALCYYVESSLLCHVNVWGLRHTAPAVAMGCDFMRCHEGLRPQKTMTSMEQVIQKYKVGPEPIVINGVITSINGLING